MNEFPPDSSLVAAVDPSPNFNRRRRPLDAVVLHYTGMASAEAALARLRDPAAEVSCHYLIFEDGQIRQLVPEHERAWHAGRSYWAGETDMNSASIGIELANGGVDFGTPPFAEAQIAATIALLGDILARRRIPAGRILAHSDIAPFRKADPGEAFPWARLAKAGIGHYVAPVPCEDAASDFAMSPGLRPGATGAEVEELQHRLMRYGYEIAVTGRYDDATEVVVRAFQRHFRPARVDGMADVSTRATLAALLASLPQGA